MIVMWWGTKHSWGLEERGVSLPARVLRERNLSWLNAEDIMIILDIQEISKLGVHNTQLWVESLLRSMLGVSEKALCGQVSRRKCHVEWWRSPHLWFSNVTIKGHINAMLRVRDTCSPWKYFVLPQMLIRCNMWYIDLSLGYNLILALLRIPFLPDTQHLSDWKIPLFPKTKFRSQLLC